MKRLLFCSLSLALACNAALADGILKQASGSVTINAKTGQVGDTIPSGAVVQTGSQSRADIQFDDGHTIALGSASRFQIKEYVYTKTEPSKDSMLFSLFKGTLRSISGALGARNPAKFSLATPTATIGIRGTDFLSSIVDAVGQDGIVRQQVFFTVKSGQISVVHGTATQLLGPGQSVLTTPSGAITPVAPGALPANLQELASVTGGAPAGAGATSATQAATGAVGAAGAGGAAAAVVGAAVIVSTQNSNTGSTTGSTR